ncbi:MAG: cation:proton antiporter [Gemmobacter sp.]|uniref:cation:proton antiporter n=1 Tax=Gemmobacter sp. TaxID=1898957 RepID=UPI001A5A76B8|nr:cation:proton antiporter [Gemmobacter sp.]MBL8562517.1 cation:proton antiporter [Gemmobacter sp.]
MDIVLLVSALAVLFVVIALAEPVAERLRLPYSVVLAVIGAALGATSVGLAAAWGDQLAPEVASLLALPIKSSVFMYVFLPTLIFQVALGLDLRRMLDDWVPILVMAVLAVLVATAFVGLALSPFSSMPLLACFLLGAVVSTTDPSAVVSIFRSLSTPQRLARIVEGESLLNDAAAIALFGFFLSFVMAGVPNPTLRDALIGLPTIIVSGAICGWVIARIALRAMRLLGHWPLAQLSLSIAIPYATYVIADHVLHASGVVAVVVGGMTLNWLAPGRLAPAAWTNLREVWDLLAHWAGALIFVMASLLIPRLLGDAKPADFLLILVVILAASAARIVMLWGVLPLLSSFNLSPQVERPYRIAMLWGGLRGAVTLALALAVTENWRVPSDIRRELGILATGFTLYTLFIQGSTLRRVVRALGLARLSTLDLALSRQAVAVALQTVREGVASSVKDHNLDHDIVRSEAKAFAGRLDQAVALADAETAIRQKDRVPLGLLAMTGHERDRVLEAFHDQELAPDEAERLLAQTDRLMEATRTGGRAGYLRAARRGLRFARGERWAIRVHNSLRLSRPLAQLIASRFEMLLGQRRILEELHLYIDSKIRRIHGRRVAEILHQVLTTRQTANAEALEALRLQYPGYAEELERRFIRRLALRLEEREYDTMLADGLIGREVHTALMQSMREARARQAQRPPLDLAMQKSEMLRQLPALAGLDAAQLKMVQKRIATVYAHPGDTLLRKGDPARHVFFIASGAVEVTFAGQVQKLGRGEMFGQLGILTRRPRRADARALTHCTLLRLDEARFLDLLAKNDQLRQAVEESTKRRKLMEGEALPAPVPAPAP